MPSIVLSIQSHSTWHPDPCRPVWMSASSHSEIEELGCSTSSMKPGDNEMWLGFFKNKIRPVSHLRRVAGEEDIHNHTYGHVVTRTTR